MASLHHIALRTGAPEALATFYERALGLSRAPRMGNGIWLVADGVVLMIEAAHPDEPPVDPGTRELLAFSPEGLSRDQFEAHLSRAGVAVEDVTNHSVYFRDPDGRRLALSDYPFEFLIDRRHTAESDS